jgi:hypothetical protein
VPLRTLPFISQSQLDRAAYVNAGCSVPHPGSLSFVRPKETTKEKSARTARRPLASAAMGPAPAHEASCLVGRSRASPARDPFGALTHNSARSGIGRALARPAGVRAKDGAHQSLVLGRRPEYRGRRDAPGATGASGAPYGGWENPVPNALPVLPAGNSTDPLFMSSLG